MTIHDIGMIKNHHEPIKNLIRKYLYFKLPIRFLKRVSCISELTKNDLNQLFRNKCKKTLCYF